MNLLEEKFDDVFVITVATSRATISEAEEFKNKITLIIENGFNKIVIDLSQVEFIDSSFLGVLVTALKRVVAKNGDLKLVGFQPAVRSMFELTRMFRVFDTFERVDQSVASFSDY